VLGENLSLFVAHLRVGALRNIVIIVTPDLQLFYSTKLRTMATSGPARADSGDANSSDNQGARHSNPSVPRPDNHCRRCRRKSAAFCRLRNVAPPAALPRCLASSPPNAAMPLLQARQPRRRAAAAATSPTLKTTPCPHVPSFSPNRTP
jgi:hypothetical protein